MTKEKHQTVTGAETKVYNDDNDDNDDANILLLVVFSAQRQVLSH